uniref:Sulfatase N-terminal domain-containing protein n=1 Tax=Spermophilus dauricus TaxID=99837 RepID=A0A8C9PTG3_SPEDA
MPNPVHLFSAFFVFLCRDSTLLLFLVCWLLQTCEPKSPNASKPNILLILADDLGIGDVGCYGNHTLRTPNIDRLAKEGVRLTQHLAAAPLCTPSRAAFLTGRYALRSGMDNHEYRVLYWNAGSGGLPANETTFAKILKQQGYATGLVGMRTPDSPSIQLSRDQFSPEEKNHFHPSPPLESVPGPALALSDGLQFRSSHCRGSSRYTRILALGVLTLAAAKLSGLLSVPWTVVGGAAGLVFLFFITWFSSCGFVRRWNCVLMRNHQVTEQPMDVGSTTQRMLQEATAYSQRWGPSRCGRGGRGSGQVLSRELLWGPIAASVLERSNLTLHSQMKGSYPSSWMHSIPWYICCRIFLWSHFCPRLSS